MKNHFLIILMFPYFITIPELFTQETIINNVGQGLWVTQKGLDYCIHFDLGGEYYNNKINRSCKNKMNYFIISHWDYDHVNFIKKYQKQTNAFCFVNQNIPDFQAKKLKIKIPYCNQFQILKLSKNGLFNFKPKLSHRLHFYRPKIYQTTINFNPKKMSSELSNNMSEINYFTNVLFPGDSYQSAEQKWVLELIKNNIASKVRVLILGHHGSKTSTSSFLLRNLPNLKMAIASARKKRYGHPHVQTLERLKNIAVLKTEDWGHIHLESP